MRKQLPQHPTEDTPTPPDFEGDLIQACTDIYYDCHTIKRLDELTDKACDILAAAQIQLVSELLKQLKADEQDGWTVVRAITVLLDKKQELEGNK